MRKIIYIIPFLFLAVACEKDISVDLPKADTKIVVDGYVETGLPPYLILSKTSGYFEPIDSGLVNNNAESGATIIVNDGFTTDTMIEIDTVINGRKVSGIYAAANMTGTTGRTYAINITTANGAKLSASTKLQTPIQLDSVWFKFKENNDSLGFVWANLHDPDTLGNCYRWFAKRTNKDSFFISPSGGEFDDRFVNGKKFDFAYNRGSVPNSTAEDDNNEEANFFKVGDTVVVKFCVIDRPVYEFWRDAENQITNNGSPFAVPSNVKSNITGGLGLWGAYSPSYDTVYVKR